jgi:hypothetical protein
MINSTELSPREKHTMIQIISPYLSKTEMSLIRQYTKFVLNRFVRRSVQNKSLIRIKIAKIKDFDDYADREDLSNYKAWCYYEGQKNNRRVFNVVLNACRINSKAKKDIVRVKNILIDLGHELVHVKQYLNNEIFEYVSGGTRYKGSFFDNSYTNNEELYYDSPWEIEAYGRELGLYNMFYNNMQGAGRI